MDTVDAQVRKLKRGGNRLDSIAGNGNGHSAPADPKVVKETLRISTPNLRKLRLTITGTAPYLQCRFSKKAMDKMKGKQMAGDQNGKRAARKPRDFKADYLGAMHKMSEKEYGIPASAFRQAAISACRLVGFKMTIAKLSIFVVPDGFDTVDDTPLVKLNGKPQYHEMVGRNADGSCDLRVRAIWRKWSAIVTVKFDADQFSASDVFNLFCRIGEQVGIGEGRPDSKKSAGMGMGTFDVAL